MLEVISVCSVGGSYGKKEHIEALREMVGSVNQLDPSGTSNETCMRSAALKSPILILQARFPSPSCCGVHHQPAQQHQFLVGSIRCKECDRITRQLRLDGWPALSSQGDFGSSRGV
ncbi:hypothetical protein F0562_017773 [Nyssa sinensis]|uniref:Uncharacterized protein n=1 Tax=Nyssa sinensis TaxID=561372 RepID=A0A5J4ZG28_9ASTE|nr:hypothetical protein F0562_017773 [Nyssa sinensis]